MEYKFPIFLNCNVEMASVSCDLHHRDGKICADYTLSVTLRADYRSNGDLILSTGASIGDMDINFSFMSKFSQPSELDADLFPGDVGFITHTMHEGTSFVHGCAIWPSDNLPLFLLDKSFARQIRLCVEQDNLVDSNRWGINRENRLRISGVSLSAV